MFRRKSKLMRSDPRYKRGPAETEGNVVVLSHGKTMTGWRSQRKAAKALGVSPNRLSKHLSGKSPKL